MAALSADRNTRKKAQGTNRRRRRNVEANTTCYLGGLAAINAAGNMVPASDIAGLIIVGVFEETVTCGSVAGAVDVGYMTGVEVELDNAASAVVQGTLKCTAVDDHSVSTAAVTTHDVPVGVVTGFSSVAGMVWVYIDEMANQTASS